MGHLGKAGFVLLILLGSIFAVPAAPVLAGGSESGSQGSTDYALDIAFVIDTTGSMWDDIDAVKRNVTRLVDEIQYYFPDARFSLVDFRDWPESSFDTEDWPGKIVLPFTYNTEDFIFAVNNLSAWGGGDWPESHIYALSLAINNLTWRKNVYKAIILITDAPPHDPEIDGTVDRSNLTYRDIIAMANENDVHIYSVLCAGYWGEESHYIWENVSTSTGGRYAYLSDTSSIVGWILDAVEGASLDLSNTRLSIGTDKKVYDPNETIEITVNVYDADGRCQYPLRERYFSVMFNGTYAPIDDFAVVSPCEAKLYVTAPSESGVYNLTVRARTSVGWWPKSLSITVRNPNVDVEMSAGWVSLTGPTVDEGTGIYFADYFTGTMLLVNYGYRAIADDYPVEDNLTVVLIGVSEDGSETKLAEKRVHLRSDLNGYFSGRIDLGYIDRGSKYWVYYVVVSSDLADSAGKAYQRYYMVYSSPVYISTQWSGSKLVDVSVKPFASTPEQVVSDFVVVNPGMAPVDRVFIVNTRYFTKYLDKALAEIPDSGRVYTDYITGMAMPAWIKLARDSIKEGYSVAFTNNDDDIDSVHKTYLLFNTFRPQNVVFVGPYPTEEAVFQGIRATKEYENRYGNHPVRLSYSDVLNGFDLSDGNLIEYSDDSGLRGLEYAKPFLVKKSGYDTVKYPVIDNESPYVVVSPKGYVPLVLSTTYHSRPGAAEIFTGLPLHQRYIGTIEFDIGQIILNALSGGGLWWVEYLASLNAALSTDGAIDVSARLGIEDALWAKFAVGIGSDGYLKVRLNMGLHGKLFAWEVHKEFSWTPLSIKVRPSNGDLAQALKYMEETKYLRRNHVRDVIEDTLESVSILGFNLIDASLWIVNQVTSLGLAREDIVDMLSSMYNLVDEALLRVDYALVGVMYSSEYLENALVGSDATTMLPMYALEPASAHTLMRQISEDIASGKGDTIPRTIDIAREDYIVRAGSSATISNVMSWLLEGLGGSDEEGSGSHTEMPSEDSKEALPISLDIQSDISVMSYTTASTDINTIILGRDIRAMSDDGKMAEITRITGFDALAAELLGSDVDAPELEGASLLRFIKAYADIRGYPAILQKLPGVSLHYGILHNVQIKKRHETRLIHGYVSLRVGEFKVTAGRVSKFISNILSVTSKVFKLWADLETAKFNSNQVYYIGPPGLRTAPYDDPSPVTSPTPYPGVVPVNVTLKPMPVETPSGTYLLINTTSVRFGGDLPDNQTEVGLIMYSPRPGVPQFQGYRFIFTMPQNQSITGISVVLFDAVTIENVTPARIEYTVGNLSSPYIVPADAVYPIVPYSFRTYSSDGVNYGVVTVYPVRFYESNSTAVYFRSIRMNVTFGEYRPVPDYVALSVPEAVGMGDSDSYNLSVVLFRSTSLSVDNVTVGVASLRGIVVPNTTLERVPLGEYSVIPISLKSTGTGVDMLNVTVNYTVDGARYSISRGILVVAVPKDLVDLDVGLVDAPTTVNSSGVYYVTVALRNLGNYTAYNVPVRLVLDGSLVLSSRVVNEVSPGNPVLVKLPMNLSGIGGGVHNITAVVNGVPNEVILSNNIATGEVLVESESTGTVSSDGSVYINGYRVNVDVPNEASVGGNFTVAIHVVKLLPVSDTLNIEIETSSNLGGSSLLRRINGTSSVFFVTVPKTAGVGVLNVTLESGVSSVPLSYYPLILDFTLNLTLSTNVTSPGNLTEGTPVSLNATVTVINGNPSFAYLDRTLEVYLLLPNGTVHNVTVPVKYLASEPFRYEALFNISAAPGEYTVMAFFGGDGTVDVYSMETLAFIGGASSAGSTRTDSVNSVLLLSKVWTQWYLNYHRKVNELVENGNLSRENPTVKLAIELDQNATSLILEAWGIDDVSVLEGSLWSLHSRMPNVAKIRNAYLMEKRAFELLTELVH
ncbi:VWA domain-containing protein [Thermococcus indicus]|nr:VWA domain-containing protein [Thermococcus indicus]